MIPRLLLPLRVTAAWLLIGQCSALAPLARVSIARRSRSLDLALEAGDGMHPSQQDEIRALKAKLRAAEATIAELSSLRHRRPDSLQTELSTNFEDSRFPLFRKAQSALDDLWARRGRDIASDGHAFANATLPTPGEEAAATDPATGARDASVERLFKQYDADNSGLIDIDEFSKFVEDASRGLVEVIPSFPEFCVVEEVERFGEWSKETYQTAETAAKDTAKSVMDAVNNLGASLPGAAAAVPFTLVGGVGNGYKALLPLIAAGKGVPVEGLILAIERQATISAQLGGFMQLIVKLDEANMRTVRQAWEKHGRPATVRELLVMEVADGVQEPARLKEGSASLSLLWSMRSKRFWTIVADGFAEQDNSEPSSAFGIRAYAEELEPYHGFILRNTFRTGLRALPSRTEMLGNMALMPTEKMGLDACWADWKESAAAGECLAPEERMAACLVELRECSEATKRVSGVVQAQLDEFGLRDDRKL